MRTVPAGSHSGVEAGLAVPLPGRRGHAVARAAVLGEPWHQHPAAHRHLRLVARQGLRQGGERRLLVVQVEQQEPVRILRLRRPHQPPHHGAGRIGERFPGPDADRPTGDQHQPGPSEPLIGQPRLHQRQGPVRHGADRLGGRCECRRVRFVARGGRVVARGGRVGEGAEEREGWEDRQANTRSGAVCPASTASPRADGSAYVSASAPAVPADFSAADRPVSPSASTAQRPGATDDGTPPWAPSTPAGKRLVEGAMRRAELVRLLRG